MKNVPGFLLLIGSWIQPLHLLPWVSWHSELLAFAALASFLWVEALGLKKLKVQFFTVPSIALLPIALAVTALVQYFFGLIVFFGDVLVIDLYLLMCSMAIAVGHAWANHGAGVSEEEAQNRFSLLDQLAITVVVGAALSVLIALAQALEVWTWADWIVRLGQARRPGSNLGQPNNFATLLLMGMVSLAYLFEAKKISGRFATSLLLLFTLGLAISESRTGLLGSLIVTLWWLVKRRAANFRAGILHVATLWATLLISVSTWPTLLAHIQLMGSGSASIDTSAGTRMIVWPQLAEAVFERPVFGWGLREISKAHNAVLDRYTQGEPFTYAHNLILDLAVGLGLPLTLVVLGFGIFFFAARAVTVKSLRNWYCIALCIPVAVHSMLEFPFAYAYFLLPVMLALGMLEANMALARQVRVRLDLALAGAGLAGALLLWSMKEYIAIEEDFRIARFEALHIGTISVQYERPNITLLTQLDAMLRATRMVPAPGMPSAQIELLGQAAMRFPWTAIQNRYALSLALNGDPAEATRQLRVMRAMHGEKAYSGIKTSWAALAQEKHRQLREIELP